MSAPDKAATIIAYLANNGGWYRVDEIALGVGMAESYVRDRLKSLLAEGLVERRVFEPKGASASADHDEYKAVHAGAEQWRKAA
ncbi:MAG: helix-turn-helix domain-containing protein [Sphingomonadales bacterium]|nr:helix-turn-helix domain-containing protein [Sphingomonadaceae bacterium]MBS3929590.1 helix-turn-helix domain-containing protein [Sphingomonadales bacterium]